MEDRKKKYKIRKDTKFIKVFESRGTYFIILILILIYLFQDKKILNVPYYLVLIRYLISLVVIILIFWPRFRKYRQFYISEITKFLFLDKIILFVGIAFLIFISQSVLSIPLNLAIKRYSRVNGIKYHNCKITNVITTDSDKIHFLFLDRKYSRYFDVSGYTRKELINNYYLELG